ncbi:hypothetical protein AAGF08_10060 [Algoriphagus sp. SE2]|uniref:hypothetical protein n=1 Tax=Algoriphagus sp. SE2 TaxID=3141536 RepID=UPI0031CD1BA4
MNKKLLITALVLLTLNFAYGQDANNPIDPNPTFGLFNRFYSDNESRLQFLANVTYGKWFLRFTAEYEFNYNNEPGYSSIVLDDGKEINENHFSSTNILVARTFKSKDGNHSFGVGGVVSYLHERRFAGGLNFVSVSKVNGWRYISLVTLQAGKETFLMEFQPGIYRDFNNGWYFRSHPRMLFNFETGNNEIPIGAGIGKIFKNGTPVVNVFLEPQYDLANDVIMLYAGVKTLF